MRAVNLIPDDQRRSAVRGPGRSQGAVYAVLVLLGGLAILAGLYGSARHKISSNQAEVSSLAVQAQQAQATASRLAPYTNFISLRNQRVEAVNALVASRFDWAHAFQEVGRVLPAGVWLTNVSGSAGSGAASTASAAPATGASGASGSAGVSSTTPPGSVVSFSLSGCAGSQAQVALTLDRLRLIDGVSEVTLQSSAIASGAATGSGLCSKGEPAFDATVTFQPLPAASSSSASATSPKTTISATGAGG